MYMHYRDVLHCDLCDETVMISDDCITMIDFGVACFSPDGRLRAKCGRYMWRSPEMVRMERGSPGYGVDGKARPTIFGVLG